MSSRRQAAANRKRRQPVRMTTMPTLMTTLIMPPTVIADDVATSKPRGCDEMPQRSCQKKGAKHKARIAEIQEDIKAVNKRWLRPTASSSLVRREDVIRLENVEIVTKQGQKSSHSAQSQHIRTWLKGTGAPVADERRGESRTRVVLAQSLIETGRASRPRGQPVYESQIVTSAN